MKILRLQSFYLFLVLCSGHAWGGTLEGNASNNRGDYEAEFKEYLLSAQQGDKDAQWLIGDMYYEGKGVEQDYQEAFLWFHKAALLGLMEGQQSLGDMYLQGYGVDQDYQKAFKWLYKAAH